MVSVGSSLLSLTRKFNYINVELFLLKVIKAALCVIYFLISKQLLLGWLFKYMTEDQVVK